MTEIEIEVLAFLQDLGEVKLQEGKDHAVFELSHKTIQIKKLAGMNDLLTDLTVWEDLWHTRKEIVQGRLINTFQKATSIHGRETHCIRLTKPVAKAFLEANHLQGATNSKLQLGLEYQNEIVAVATFSKPCPIDRDGRTWKSIELLRYCCLPGKSVVGGLSKLLKNAATILEPEDIMTYVDLEWSNGSGFKRLGFIQKEITPPRAFFVDPLNMTRHFNPDPDHPDRVEVRNRGSIKMIKELI